MAQTIFDPGVRDSLVQRLHTLTPERRPQWGRMSAPQMVSHLIQACRMACGEVPVQVIASPLRYYPLNWLIIHWLPWPKGAPTAPELLSRQPEHWDRDVDDLVARIRKFSERNPGGQWPPHPAFGAISGASWGVLAYRHIDHHFEQFGI
jgi:hypothetical protein